MAEAQLSLSFLEEEFKVPSARRTLKTSIRKGTKLETAVTKAYKFVQGNLEGYTAMEFKYGPCYIVVAKLKEQTAQ